MSKVIVNELYNVVCNTEQRKREFLKLFFSGDKRRFGLDLLSYRNWQIKQNRGQNINADNLRNAKSNDELRQLLTELFIYPVMIGDLKTIHEYNIDFDEIITEHRNDPHYSIGRILHILIEKKYKIVA